MVERRFFLDGSVNPAIGWSLVLSLTQSTGVTCTSNYNTLTLASAEPLYNEQVESTDVVLPE